MTKYTMLKKLVVHILFKKCTHEINLLHHNNINVKKSHNFFFKSEIK